MVTTLKQKEGLWRNGPVSNARNFWNHRRSQTLATHHCYLTSKVGAHLQVPVFSSLMTCLVWKRFTLFFAQRHLYIPKEHPIDCSSVLTTGFVKGSAACHVLTWKKSVSPGSVCSSAQSYMLALGWAFAGLLSFLFYWWFIQRLWRWLWGKIINRLTSLLKGREWTVGMVNLGLTLCSQLLEMKIPTS